MKRSPLTILIERRRIRFVENAKVVDHRLRCPRGEVDAPELKGVDTLLPERSRVYCAIVWWNGLGELVP